MEGPEPAAAADGEQGGSLARLDVVEQSIIEALKLAGGVMAELAKGRDASGVEAGRLATEALHRVRRCQDLLRSEYRSTSTVVMPRATAYVDQQRVDVAKERIQIAQEQLRHIERVLSGA
ncbi:unnamed protein product [Pedinophyceae sp. YPF-701]|nr:unnamed protein product [Pedinophyceae sp. YPF-701]